MNEDTLDTLEVIRLGAGCIRDADYLKCVIAGLETQIKQLKEKLKGDSSEEKSPINIEVLCTCRDGSCSSQLPKRGSQ